jgi:ribosomal protein L11 methyltransferase
MSNYIQIAFQNISQEQSDMLIAQLAGIGYDGFEEEMNVLKAFVAEKAFDEDALHEIVSPLQLDFSKSFIEETNWNQVWESNFDPVIVDDFVAVRADFHQPVTNVKHEIIITPKMSFGTGHHATTYMMMRQMGEIDFADKTVFDFGTGTGVLAILAEKLGAKNILAIDNDPWSMDNATENIGRNGCTKIDIKLTNTGDMKGSFDIILANINKNVILDNLKSLADQLKPGGFMFLSGLLVEDEPEILQRTGSVQLRYCGRVERNNWLFMKLSH